jgi:hypothetical protein
MARIEITLNCHKEDIQEVLKLQKSNKSLTNKIFNVQGKMEGVEKALAFN